MAAKTGTGDNDTSVIRGPAIKKAGRSESYGVGQQPTVWRFPFMHLGDEIELNAAVKAQKQRGFCVLMGEKLNFTEGRKEK